MGTSKVYILDKYFNELQKFWDTEKRLQGNSHPSRGNKSVKRKHRYCFNEVVRKKLRPLISDFNLSSLHNLVFLTSYWQKIVTN